MMKERHKKNVECAYLTDVKKNHGRSVLDALIGLIGLSPKIPEEIRRLYIFPNI